MYKSHSKQIICLGFLCRLCFSSWSCTAERNPKGADKHLGVEEDNGPRAIPFHPAAVLSLMKPKDYVQPKFLSTSVCWLSLKDKFVKTAKCQHLFCLFDEEKPFERTQNSILLFAKIYELYILITLFLAT